MAKSKKAREVASRAIEQQWIAWNYKWDGMLPSGRYFGRKDKPK